MTTLEIDRTGLHLKVINEFQSYLTDIVGENITDGNNHLKAIIKLIEKSKKISEIIEQMNRYYIKENNELKKQIQIRGKLSSKDISDIKFDIHKSKNNREIAIEEIKANTEIKLQELQLETIVKNNEVKLRQLEVDEKLRKG